jgi:hypothetical protein
MNLLAGLAILWVVLVVVVFIGYLLIYIVGGIVAGICSLFESKPNPPQARQVFCATPLMSQSRAPYVPGGTDNWAQYAMHNPQVKLQMVEKLEIADSQFSAEKHMKMTGPVQNYGPGYDQWGQKFVVSIMPSSVTRKTKNPT